MCANRSTCRRAEYRVGRRSSIGVQVQARTTTSLGHTRPYPAHLERVDLHARGHAALSKSEGREGHSRGLLRTCTHVEIPAFFLSVKIRPCDLRPALAKLIHSAMTLTPDGFVAAMTTHPPTPAGRPRFAYHIPECSLPNPHTVPGTLPFEISSPPSHLGRHGWTIPLLHLRRRPPILTPCVT